MITSFIMFWVLGSIAVSIWAKNRGRSGMDWFIIAALISPILAAIFLAVMANRAPGLAPVSPDTHGKCPACSEPVLLTAKVCKHCRSNMEEMGGIQVERRRASIKNSNGYKAVFWTIFGLIVLAFVLGSAGKP